MRQAQKYGNMTDETKSDFHRNSAGNLWEKHNENFQSYKLYAIWKSHLNEYLVFIMNCYNTISDKLSQAVPLFNLTFKGTLS